MKKIIYITLILLCNMGIAKAQDYDEHNEHLNPVRGIYNISNSGIEHCLKVRKVLFNGLSDYPEIGFQVIPSFTPASVLQIEFDGNNKYYIIYHIFEQMDFTKGEVNKFKIEIDKESVDLIKSLFSTAIAQVRYPKEEFLGYDGTNYYFSIKESGLLKSGTVWSPNEKTKMGKLVAIGYKLIELAKSEKEVVKFDAKLQKEIEDLINELKK